MPAPKIKGKVTGMEKREERKTTMEYMEYLVSLLHREWAQSGRTEVEVMINPQDVPQIGQMIMEVAAKRQKQDGKEGMELERSMELSKEDYVFLRLMKKIKAERNMAKSRASNVPFHVGMDREEYLLFSMLLKRREA